MWGSLLFSLTSSHAFNWCPPWFVSLFCQISYLHLFDVSHLVGMDDPPTGHFQLLAGTMEWPANLHIPTATFAWLGGYTSQMAHLCVQWGYPSRLAHLHDQWGYSHFLFGVFVYKAQVHKVLTELWPIAGCWSSCAVKTSYCIPSSWVKDNPKELLLRCYHWITPPGCCSASFDEPWLNHTFKHYMCCCEQLERTATRSEVILFVTGSWKTYLLGTNKLWENSIENLSNFCMNFFVNLHKTTIKSSCCEVSHQKLLFPTGYGLLLYQTDQCTKKVGFQDQVTFIEFFWLINSISLNSSNVGKCFHRSGMACCIHSY